MAAVRAAEGGGSGGEGEPGYHYAISLSELQRLGRKRITVEERVMELFHVKGRVYAMDHFCYREWHGSPITNLY